MIRALLVSSTRTSFSDLDSAFTDDNVETAWVKSGRDALKMIGIRSFDLIITDEILPDMTGLDLVRKLISKNPMLNMAVVSTLSPADFHEAGEGLGILMQLPQIPEKSDAENLLEHLKHILSLTKNPN